MHHTTALSFLKKGYQVIPLSKKTGRPIIKFKDIQITEDIIKNINWFDCDYALLMRGMWCIDIDTHKMTDEKLASDLKIMMQTMGVDLLSVLSTERYNNGLDGYSSLLKSEYKEELIGNFKKTFVEITASGGMHILFKKRDGVDYSQKPSVLPSIDIKAHDNNYVKIFPSDGREVLQAVKELPHYKGKFEEAIFKPKENFTTYFSGSIVKPKSTGNHEGREAYERVATGTSYNRNDDLFKGACWAFENDIDIDDLTSIIGTVKGRDIFTREEFELTIESAKRKVGTRYSIPY